MTASPDFDLDAEPFVSARALASLAILDPRIADWCRRHRVTYGTPLTFEALEALGLGDDALAEACEMFGLRPAWVCDDCAEAARDDCNDCNDVAPLVGLDMVPLLTAARRIGMHPRAARRAAASGLIPAERSGPRGWWHVPRGWADAMTEEAARRRKPDRPDTR